MDDLKAKAELACVLPWEKSPAEVPYAHKAAFKDACTPQAVLALIAVAEAAQTYFNGYVQDEAEDGAMLDKGWPSDRLYSGASDKQAREAFALREALAAIRGMGEKT